jgi:hypothetical protein
MIEFQPNPPNYEPNSELCLGLTNLKDIIDIIFRNLTHTE